MANGRMHHHDKHAASKDGHRPDDPHGVTNGAYPRGSLWREQQADAMEADQLAGGIQREGHEPYSDEKDYGQTGAPYTKKAMFGQDYPPPPPPPPRQSNESEQAHIAANTQGFGPEETRWRADADEADRADASKWQRDRASDRKMEERTGRPSPPRPFPESRFTREGTGPGSPQRETKTPAPPRQDGLSHQRTPSDAAAVRAGPPPPPPKRKTPPPPPPPR